MFLIPLAFRISERRPFIEPVANQTVQVRDFDSRVSRNAEHTGEVRVDFLIGGECVLHLLEAEGLQRRVDVNRYFMASASAGVLVKRAVVNVVTIDSDDRRAVFPMVVLGINRRYVLDERFETTSAIGVLRETPTLRLRI